MKMTRSPPSRRRQESASGLRGLGGADGRDEAAVAGSQGWLTGRVDPIKAEKTLEDCFCLFCLLGYVVV